MDAYGPTSTKTYSSCGHFLDDLLKVVSATPYLRPVDGHRYASLIQQFSQFPLPSHASTPGPNETVSGLPEQQLEAALWRWVSSMLHEDIHPLMSTFTLDAAHFIEAHARGRTFGRFSAEWRLNPMIRAPANTGVNMLDDPQLKKNITQRIARHFVSLEIPEGERIVDSETSKLIASSGTAYLCAKRCHLSVIQDGDVDEAVVLEDHPPVHDIADKFKLRGQLWSKRAMEERMQKADTSELQRRQHFELVVPARWISAWLDEGEQQWLPVPNWTP